MSSGGQEDGAEGRPGYRPGSGSLYPPSGPYPPAGQGPYPPGPGQWGGPPPAGLSGQDPAAFGAPASSSNALSIAAMVLGGLAVLFLPILLGPAGIVCAVIGMNRKERLAKIGLGVAIGGMVLGFVLGAIFVASLGA